MFGFILSVCQCMDVFKSLQVVYPKIVFHSSITLLLVFIYQGIKNSKANGTKTIYLLIYLFLYSYIYLYMVCESLGVGTLEDCVCNSFDVLK